MESDEEEEYSNISGHPRGNTNEQEPKSDTNKEVKRKTIPNEKWSKELNARKINYNKLNEIIANYLFVQAYCHPLKKFISESKIKYNFDENLLNKRYLIRSLIMKNKIDQAIEEINSLNKNILKENKFLYFILQRQILINYIQKDQINEALYFAKKVLMPIAEGDNFLFKQLERTMGLMAYGSINDSPEKELISEKFLEKIASKTNLIILNYLKSDKKINFNLETIVQLMNFNQNELKKEIDFPLIKATSPLTFTKVNNN